MAEIDIWKFSMSFFRGKTMFLFKFPWIFVPEGPTGSESALVPLMTYTHRLNQWSTYSLCNIVENTPDAHYLTKWPLKNGYWRLSFYVNSWHQIKKWSYCKHLDLYFNWSPSQYFVQQFLSLRCFHSINQWLLSFLTPSDIEHVSHRNEKSLGSSV